MSKFQVTPELELMDSSSNAAICADKTHFDNNLSIETLKLLAGQQTSSNYSHGRNMSNSSSFKPSKTYLELSDNQFTDSNSLLSSRLESYN